MAKQLRETAIPKNDTELVKLYGEALACFVGRLDKGRKGGDDLLQHVYLQVVHQKVLEKYRAKIASLQEVVTIRRFKQEITGAEAAAYLGVKFVVLRICFWRRVNGDRRFKKGVPQSFKDGVNGVLPIEEFWRQPPRWIPPPLRGMPCSPKAVYRTADVLTFDSLKPFRTQTDRAPLPEEVVTDVNVSPEGKVTMSFWSYLARAVHNIFANWCRTAYRKNKERFLGESWEETFTGDDETFSWSERLSDPFSVSRIEAGVELRQAGLEAVNDAAKRVLSRV